MERWREGERGEEGKKKRERKEAQIRILNLGFEVYIYISKHYVFFHCDKKQPENFLK